MAKLEISVLIGAESKEWIATLTDLVDRLEAATSATTTTTETKAKAPVTAKKAKVTTTPVEEETFDLGGEEVEDTETVDEEPVTMNDVIAACKANRTKAVKLLKTLKVKSVHELKPAQYPKVLAELGA